MNTPWNNPACLVQGHSHSSLDSSSQEGNNKDCSYSEEAVSVSTGTDLDLPVGESIGICQVSYRNVWIGNIMTQPLACYWTSIVDGPYCYKIYDLDITPHSLKHTYNSGYYWEYSNKEHFNQLMNVFIMYTSKSFEWSYSDDLNKSDPHFPPVQQCRRPACKYNLLSNQFYS